MAVLFGPGPRLRLTTCGASMKSGLAATKTGARASPLEIDPFAFGCRVSAIPPKIAP